MKCSQLISKFMFNNFLYILIIISLLISNNYIVNPDYGTISIDSEIYEQPFLAAFNKPKIQWIDWNQDGNFDLFILDEDGAIRYYERQNNGEFKLLNTNFMMFNNISWFYIGDFDNDSNYEIMTQDPSNTNQVIYYNNDGMDLNLIGTVYDTNSNPIESNAVMTPTFIDIDNDSDLDFFTGNMVGTISYYENIGFSSNQMPEYQLITNFWEDIYIVGSSSQRHGASAITFIDIDQDEDFDLSWGDYYQQSLYIIENIGTIDEPDMDIDNIINQYPPESPIITAGQNMPTFIDIDNDQDQDLFVTVLSGAYGYQLINNFFYFENINGIYTYQTSNFIKTIDLVSDTYPTFIDIDNDGDLDLFIGTDFDISSFPWTGRIYYFENIGMLDGEPQWDLIDNEFLGNDLGNNLAIDFADIDNDGDFDIFIGDFNGYVTLYLNIGSSSNPNYVFQTVLENIDLSGYSTPKLIDIDSDNDLDLFIGDMNGYISFYRNEGTNELFNFVLSSHNYQDVFVGSRASPEFIDIDSDGDYDLIVGSQYQGLSYYENIGSQNEANFISNNEITFPNIGKNLYPSFFTNQDSNNLLVGMSTGGMYYLSINDCSLGDLNLDSIVNVIDIIFVINLILGDVESNETFLCSGDLNNDSIINVLDVMEIIQIIIDL